MKDYHTTSYIKPIFQTPDDACYWFGYYNYDPINSDGTKLLCNRAEFDAVPIKRGMTIELGYFDLPTGLWHSIGKTDSFNWQQGAMLQWIPSMEAENKVICNCSNGGRLVSRIYDISTGKSKDLDYPIYGITPDGKKSIALNMERAYWCRGYHYESVANPKYDVDVAEDDGIYEIDLEANTCRRIISINDVISMDYDPSFSKAKHWLEHVMINPEGTRFCFLHRFSYGNIYQYETRLLIADIDGSNMQIIDGWRKYKWSHFGWGCNNKFAIYAYTKPNNASPLSISDEQKVEFQPKGNGLKETIKMAYHKIVPLKIQMFRQQKQSIGTRFYQYYVPYKGSYEKKEEWGDSVFCIDGHPSFSLDDKFMITDSYPDWRGFQHLIAFNKSNHRALELGKFKDALTRKPGSCDLHPKLSRTNKHLTIDTAYDGRHHVIAFEIDWEKIKKATSSEE